MRTRGARLRRGKPRTQRDHSKGRKIIECVSEGSAKEKCNRKCRATWRSPQFAVDEYEAVREPGRRRRAVQVQEHRRQGEQEQNTGQEYSKQGKQEWEEVRWKAQTSWKRRVDQLRCGQVEGVQVSSEGR